MNHSGARFPARKTSWLAAFALVVAVVLVFGQVGSFGFVDYDDGDYVFRNQHLREGPVLDRVRWAFTTLYASNWHPLTWLSFIADGVLFGLDPAWLHAENLALHAINAVLLLGILVRFTGSVGRSALVAAFFALHPLRVESVAWVTERKGLLMALFSLAAISAYGAYARRPTGGRYAVVAGLFAAALLAKPQAVALPLLLLLLDWWPLGRFDWRSPPAVRLAVLGEKLPLLAFAGVATLLTIAAQRQAGAVAPLAALSVQSRVASALVAPASYLTRTLWPAGLSPVYPLASPTGWRVAAALSLLVAVTLAAWRWRGTRPWLLVGWAGFLVLLAPVSNLFQAGGQASADRYTYLPHLPLLVLLLWSRGRRRARNAGLRVATVALVAGALVALGVAAHRQTAWWRGDLELFTRAVAVTEGNWKMHYNLANTLDRIGRMSDAERHYRLALAARPDYPEALNNLGALLGRRGEQGLAEALFMQAVRLAPGYGPGWFNLGFSREQSGDGRGALEAYGRAAALQPGAAEPRIKMGRILLGSGRRAAALAACREALRIDPASTSATDCLRQASVPGEAEGGPGK